MAPICFHETSIKGYKHPSLQLNWLPGVLPLDVKRPGREGDFRAGPGAARKLSTNPCGIYHYWVHSE